ncbi:MAG: peptidoglycan DD-metalloendopeptidase family protein [bacterium]|nr:peptidoglycan DD-metalloendopeptidase family protein [bacterium]
MSRGSFTACVSACVSACVLGVLLASTASAQDRQEELDALRDRIHDSRERVTGHEADERALLEQLEDVDRRLTDVIRERDAARRDVVQAQTRVDALGPELDRARSALSSTQRALSARAVALYRGGELGPVRVLFSSESLPEMLTRASALRVLVRHDAGLVARHAEERDRLEAVEARERAALEERREADARLAGHAKRLAGEREQKGTILVRVREDRTTERRLLLELEQAAQALEETIRNLGSRASSGGVGGGFRERKGKLAPPVAAKVVERFGKVIDPEFRTTTFRSGIDFGAEAGVSVRAVAPGLVRFAGWFRGYGRIVIVDHGDGFHTISGHLDAIHVKVGTPVEDGEPLGTVGETGSLYGPSLYFELRENGQPVDPEPWLLDPRA